MSELQAILDETDWMEVIMTILHITLLPLLASLSSLAPANDAARTTWARTYGGYEDDRAEVVKQTADGGFIVAGMTQSFGAANIDVWLVRLNGGGQVVWEKRYGGIRNDYMFTPDTIKETSDGGFIFVGLSGSFVGNKCDAWVVKLDKNGGVTWQRTYGGPGYDDATGVIPLADGGYVVSGITDSFGAGDWDLWVMRMDSRGNIRWQKTYGTRAAEDACSVRLTADKGFLLVGRTGAWDGTILLYSEMLCIKLDANGNVKWQKAYRCRGIDDAGMAEQTSDGGFLVAGSTYSRGTGNSDIWVLKLNSVGGIVWQKVYDAFGIEGASAMRRTQDGGLVVVGTSDNVGNGKAGWCIKLGPYGGITWQKAYGGNSGVSIADMQQTADGGYILAGRSAPLGSSVGDFFMVRTSPKGDTCPQIVTPTQGVAKSCSATVRDPRCSMKSIVNSGRPSSGYAVSTKCQVTDACLDVN